MSLDHESNLSGHRKKAYVTTNMDLCEVVLTVKHKNTKLIPMLSE